MLSVWRILLLVSAILLIWHIVASGVTAHYLRLTKQGDIAASDRVTESSPHRPEAAYKNAVEILEQDSAGATRLLKRAFAENPADAVPLLALAQIARDAGDNEQAAALIATASRLMPANPTVQRAVGNYWFSRGDLGAAINHWSQALEAYPEASGELFPILLQLVEEPQTIGAFQPLAASPPAWWEQFFRETARRALDLETVRTLYGYRRAANRESITRKERDLYIRRLTKEGKIPEAYLVWLNGLDSTERAQLGIINNGGFEIEPSNSGFDWHLGATDRVIATTGTTAGVEGEKALHLMFRNREKRFRHVRQPLFLDPGPYRVEGMVRTDSLDSQGGLNWIVRCLGPDTSVLGKSERFLGSSEWRNFSFAVQVPDNCAVQEIRLVSAGKRDFEHKITGGIWFDQMSMRKVPTQTTEVISSNLEEEKAIRGENDASDKPELKVLGVATENVFIFHPSVTGTLDN